VESLWDAVLPVEVRELPEDLQRIDTLLSDPTVPAPISGPLADGGRGVGALGRGARPADDHDGDLCAF
jgi:hypothetical protein